MSTEKAKKHYLGQDNHARLNCAHAVLKAFENVVGVDLNYKCKGGGQSPGGECGALCAAKEILSIKNPQKITEIEIAFRETAGSTKCLDIRRNRKLSCLGCVEKAAMFVEENI